MERVLFVLADYADVSREGKLNMMGVFDQLNATGFPTRHPQMHVVLKLRAELGDIPGNRTLTIRLLNQDGAEIGNMSQPFDVPDTVGGRRQEMNFIMALRDLVFPAPGQYDFVVLVDKENLGSTTLTVNQVQPSAE